MSMHETRETIKRLWDLSSQLGVSFDSVVRIYELECIKEGIEIKRLSENRITTGGEACTFNPRHR